MQETSHNDTLLGRPLLHPLQEGPQGCLPAGLQQESQASEQHLQRRKENLSPSFTASLLQVTVGGSRGPALPCRGSGQATEEVTGQQQPGLPVNRQCGPGRARGSRDAQLHAQHPSRWLFHPRPQLCPFFLLKCRFPGSPVVETLPCNTGGV